MVRMALDTVLKIYLTQVARTLKEVSEHATETASYRE